MLHPADEHDLLHNGYLRGKPLTCSYTSRRIRSPSPRSSGPRRGRRGARAPTRAPKLPLRGERGGSCRLSARLHGAAYLEPEVRRGQDVGVLEKKRVPGSYLGPGVQLKARPLLPRARARRRSNGRDPGCPPSSRRRRSLPRRRRREPEALRSRTRIAPYGSRDRLAYNLCGPN